METWKPLQYSNKAEPLISDPQKSQVIRGERKQSQIMVHGVGYPEEWDIYEGFCCNLFDIFCCIFYASQLFSFFK